MVLHEEWLTPENQELVPLSRWQNTVNLMADLFRAPAAFIVQHGPDGFRVTIASEQEANPYPSGGIIPPDTNIFCRKIVETRKPLYVNHATADPEWETNPEVSQDGFNSYLGLPIFWPDGMPFGTICVMDFSVTHYDDTYIQLIKQFRDLVQTDLLLVQQFEQIREMALNDELTHLFNRRGFITVAEQRIQLARRNNNCLSLVFLDVDGLKVLNDNLGHEAGDVALKALARCMKSNVRGSDICARLGGDEFIILAETDQTDALKNICQRIENDFSETMPDNAPECTGVSYGIVQIDDLSASLECWMEKADKLMYSQKYSKKAAVRPDLD